MKIDAKSNEDNMVRFHNLQLGDCFRVEGALEPLYYLKIRPVHFHLSDVEDLHGNAVNLVNGRIAFFTYSSLVERCPEATVVV